MKSYEYIRLEIDMGDLDELNQLSSVGFRCVAVVRCPHDNKNYALLERPIEC